jgi:hypothetical protein
MVSSILVMSTVTHFFTFTTDVLRLAELVSVFLFAL